MSAGAPCTSPRTALYRRRQPERTVLYRTVQGHLASWLELTRDSASGTSVPAYVEREFRRYLECGVLAHGFARARCGQCGHDFLIAFPCKGRGVCPACNARRMVETAAHLTDHVMPRLPVRQWVLSVPKRLRYYLQNNPGVQTLALHIFLSAVEQGLRRCSPGRVRPRASARSLSSMASAPCSMPTCTSMRRRGGGFRGRWRRRRAFSRSPRRRSRNHRRHSGQSPRPSPAGARPARIHRARRRRGDGAWDHGGGFSLDATVRIEAHDRHGLERQLRNSRPAGLRAGTAA